jgi:hypothetical protein
MAMASTMKRKPTINAAVSIHPPYIEIKSSLSKPGNELISILLSETITPHGMSQLNYGREGNTAPVRLPHHALPDLEKSRNEE